MFITDFVVFIDFHQIKNKIAQDGKGCKGHILLLLYNIHLSGSLSKSMTIKPNVIQSATDTCVTASLCFTVHIRGTWKSASSYIYFFSKMKPTVGTVPEVLFLVYISSTVLKLLFSGEHCYCIYFKNALETVLRIAWNLQGGREH